jgi:hypothetical protein
MTTLTDRIQIEENLIDLVNEEFLDNVFNIPNANVNTSRRCSFCQCPGHNIRTCSHSDIDKLDQCAQYMYLTMCRYLHTIPNGEKTHKKWLDNLSTSEYKILAKLYRLDTNSRTKRDEFQEKIHTYCIERAEADLRNERPTNPWNILVIYSTELLNRIVTDEASSRFMMNKLRLIIKHSGRNLLDMNRFRYWLNNHLALYYRMMYGTEVPFMREHRSAVPSKNHIKMNYNASFTKESHDECPICYTDMNNDSMVQIGCSHSFCGDCIIGQIKSTCRVTVECAMCRSTINECSSASNDLLQKITLALA